MVLHRSMSLVNAVVFALVATASSNAHPKTVTTTTYTSVSAPAAVHIVSAPAAVHIVSAPAAVYMAPAATYYYGVSSAAYSAPAAFYTAPAAAYYGVSSAAYSAPAIVHAPTAYYSGVGTSVPEVPVSSNSYVSGNRVVTTHITNYGRILRSEAPLTDTSAAPAAAPLTTDQKLDKIISDIKSLQKDVSSMKQGLGIKD